MGQPCTSEIDIARIERALEDMAELLQSNSVYLPIFERLESELEAARTKQDARSRARQILEARARRKSVLMRDDPEP